MTNQEKHEDDPLRIRRTFTNGRVLSVSLRKFPIPELAEQFVELMRRELLADGSLNSPERARKLIVAFRTFGSWLADVHPEIRGLGDIRSNHVDDYETHLYETLDHGKGLPYAYTSDLLQILRMAEGQRWTSPELSERLLTGARRAITGANDPREPYSDYVAGQLLTAALAMIEGARHRIQVTAAGLLAKPETPEEQVVASILRKLFAEGPDFTARNAKLRYQLKWIKGPRRYRHAIDILELLYPTSQDSLAFIIAISLLTGIPMESIFELETDCIRNESKSYADIRYIKRRSGTEDYQSSRFPTTGGWTGPTLIKLILELTAEARKFTPGSEKSWLLLSVSERPRPGRPLLQRLAFAHQDCERFCRNHLILDDQGNRMHSFTMSRLRKTFKAQRYTENPTAARLAGDHTARIHDQHYANVEALRTLHERTIQEALQAALDGAMKSTVVTVDKDEDAPNPETPPLDDVWLAGCKDVKNSPYNEKGSSGPCRSPVWGCLACENAVITPSNLPSILAFLDHVVSMRQCLDLKSWVGRYGQVFGQITINILPHFSPEQVETAKSLIPVDSRMMWLPAELTQSL